MKQTGSISSWFKLETIASSANIFQTKVDANNKILIYYQASNNELFGTYKAGGTAATAITTEAVEGDGLWHHVAVTWDSISAREIKLYLDGTLKDTTSLTTGSITESFEDAAIGNNTSGGGFWKGNIDEVVLFNKTLDATEVSNLYNDGLPFNPQPVANMIGYWKMGDGGIVGNSIATYPTIVDETGNNNGTMTNMTSTDFEADVPE